MDDTLKHLGITEEELSEIVDSLYESGLDDDTVDDIIKHYGTLGQKWGLRRYQNADGSLTAEGRARYLKDGGLTEKGLAAKKIAVYNYDESNQKLKKMVYDKVVNNKNILLGKQIFAHELKKLDYYKKMTLGINKEETHDKELNTKLQGYKESLRDAKNAIELKEVWDNIENMKSAIEDSNKTHNADLLAELDAATKVYTQSYEKFYGKKPVVNTQSVTPKVEPKTESENESDQQNYQKSQQQQNQQSNQQKQEYKPQYQNTQQNQNQNYNNQNYQNQNYQNQQQQNYKQNQGQQNYKKKKESFGSVLVEQVIKPAIIKSGKDTLQNLLLDVGRATVLNPYKEASGLNKNQKNQKKEKDNQKNN